MTTAPDYHLVLRLEPSAVPAAVRLRRLLKAARRFYGFRCVRCEQLGDQSMRSDLDKLTQLAGWLADASAPPGGTGGDDAAVVGGCVVVATLRGGDGGPILEIHDGDYALRWHDAVVMYLRANPDCYLSDALEASRP